MRRLRVAAVWLVATFIGLGVAAATAIGPVVLRLAKTHGVHAGDLAGFGVCYLSALVITARILRAEGPSWQPDHRPWTPKR